MIKIKNTIACLLAAVMLFAVGCTSTVDVSESKDSVTSKLESVSAEESKESSSVSEEKIESDVEESSESVDNTLFSDSYSYVLNNNVATIVKYNGSDEAVTVPEALDGYSVTAIEEKAFADNAKLKAVVLCDSLVNLGAQAFASCTALESVEIGTATTVINVSAFDGCAALKAINVKAGNRSYTSIDGILYNNTVTELVRCPQTAVFTENNKLPETVVQIGEKAFAECSGVTQITLPSGCKVAPRAFFHCFNLKALTLPADITELPERCFFGCASLAEIKIPDGVATIGEYAFFGCVFAKALTIPASVTSIAQNAFDCCTMLEKVSVSGDAAKEWYTNFKKQNETSK